MLTQIFEGMQSNKHWKPVNKVTVLSPELLIAGIQLKKKKKKKDWWINHMQAKGYNALRDEE